MKTFLLTLSVATMAGGIACLGVGISELSNFDKSARSMDNAAASNLFLGGLVGAHLAAAPLVIASRIES